MARLTPLFQTRFWVPRKNPINADFQMFGIIRELLSYFENVCRV